MKTAPSIGVLVELMLLTGLVQAQSRQVCLDDQAGLNPPTLGAFHREFQSLVGARGVELVDDACPQDSIRLSVYSEAAGRDSDVLGAARIEDAKVAPQLEVYVAPVRALLSQSQCWNVIGRAMARVAAHEVAHYLDQGADHDRYGLLQARFSASDLASDDSSPFRWMSRPSRASQEAATLDRE